MRIRLAALALVACAGTPEDTDAQQDTDPCAPPGEPTLEIGLGLDGYEDLEENGGIPLIHGPQGGYHVEIGLQTSNLSAEELVGGYLEGEVGGVVLGRSLPNLDLRCMLPDRPFQESYGTLLILEALPEDLDGEVATIRAEVTDTEGTTVSAEAHFVIVDSP